jgi:eukaryotic-like serine/threonine-protein kinase
LRVSPRGDRLKLLAVGPNLFKKRKPVDAGDRREADSTQFAATVLSAPPQDFGLMPPGRPAHAVDSGWAADSLPDSAAPDSGVDSDLSAAQPGGPVSDLGADSGPTPLDATIEQKPTISHIGRYALKGMLGQGGLGQVHEAWDPLLSRNVAIKTLQFNIDANTRDALDGLFLNEARAAARLSHPNIVTVHDAGLSEHGVYIAMERLHGSDMRQRLAGGWRPTPLEAAQLVRRVADALAYAHTSGVVHCDIKPANIYLSKRERPKVLDFGIARVTRNKALLASGAMLDGAVAGSPHYLAPEQLQGGTVDARTDIHALGVVLYELLTLRKAFDGSNLLQITAAALASDPRAAHELREGVPKALSNIAAKAMARDPQQRYVSAAEMAHELRRWADRHAREETTKAQARLSDKTGRSARPATARPRKMVVGVAIASALLLGGMVTLALTLQSPKQALPRGMADLPARADAAAPTSRPREAGVAPAVAAPATATAATATAAMLTQPVEIIEPPLPHREGTNIVAAAPAVSSKPVASAAPAPAAPVTSRSKASASTNAASREARSTVAASTAVATGTVQLAISPWGNVDIDGVAAGTTPPLARITLPEGTHTITVRNAEFAPFVTTVQVGADKTVTVRHRFGQ